MPTRVECSGQDATLLACRCWQPGTQGRSDHRKPESDRCAAGFRPGQCSGAEGPSTAPPTAGSRGRAYPLAGLSGIVQLVVIRRAGGLLLRGLEQRFTAAGPVLDVAFDGWLTISVARPGGPRHVSSIASARCCPFSSPPWRCPAASGRSTPRCRRCRSRSCRCGLATCGCRASFRQPAGFGAPVAGGKPRSEQRASAQGHPLPRPLPPAWGWLVGRRPARSG